MTTPALSLFALEETTQSPYTWHPRVFVGNLTRYPDAVAAAVRRALERLEFGGIPAFGCGRRILSPLGCTVILPSGAAFPAGPGAEFAEKARQAAVRMETDNGYSFNRTFANRYLMEDTNRA